jgi:hypothetical protein
MIDPSDDCFSSAAIIDLSLPGVYGIGLSRLPPLRLEAVGKEFAK